MKETILSYFGSDAVTPEQFLDTFRRNEYLEPEKALLLAVLEDAINCFQKYMETEDRSGKERFAEAEEWIMRGGNDWLFSFDNICELLGLDPQYLRRGLREWQARAATQEKGRQHSGLRRQAA